MPRIKKTFPQQIQSIKNHNSCFKSLVKANENFNYLNSLISKTTNSEEVLLLLQNLSIYISNIDSRITTPSIPIENFLNQLKNRLLKVQSEFLKIQDCFQIINAMVFNIETFDVMNNSLIELHQYCLMIERFITQIYLTFEMIHIILKQISHESCHILVSSIEDFQKTFDQFVNEFSSKKEEISKFLNSAKEHIELIICYSESVSSLESKIQEVRNGQSTALSHQYYFANFLLSLQNELRTNITKKKSSMDILKKMIEKYASKQSAIQIECPTATQIDSILHVMSSISPQFELYRQSDSSPTARTYEQNLFNSRMRKGLNMINAMIANRNIQGIHKVCTYLGVFLERCKNRLP